MINKTISTYDKVLLTNPIFRKVLQQIALVLNKYFIFLKIPPPVLLVKVVLLSPSVPDTEVVVGDDADANGVDVACLITACNPLGQQVAVEVNLKANHSLELAIQAMGLPYYPGHGNDPKGAWKEGSYLMMGIDPVKARQLGDLYQQNAVVWISKDASPELMWLR